MQQRHAGAAASRNGDRLVGHLEEGRAVRHAGQVIDARHTIRGLGRTALLDAYRVGGLSFCADIEINAEISLRAGPWPAERRNAAPQPQQAAVGARDARLVLPGCVAAYRVVRIGRNVHEVMLTADRLRSRVTRQGTVLRAHTRNGAGAIEFADRRKAVDRTEAQAQGAARGIAACDAARRRRAATNRVHPCPSEGGHRQSPFRYQRVRHVRAARGQAQPIDSINRPPDSESGELGGNAPPDRDLEPCRLAACRKNPALESSREILRSRSRPSFARPPPRLHSIEPVQLDERPGSNHMPHVR